MLWITTRFLFSKEENEIAQIRKIYYWVRDAFLYDPYHLDISENGLVASSILTKNRAWCVEKSILLAAISRKFGFPSKLGFAIVKNHVVLLCAHFLRMQKIHFFAQNN